MQVDGPAAQRRAVHDVAGPAVQRRVGLESPERACGLRDPRPGGCRRGQAGEPALQGPLARHVAGPVAVGAQEDGADHPGGPVRVRVLQRQRRDADRLRAAGWLVFRRGDQGREPALAPGCGPAPHRRRGHGHRGAVRAGMLGRADRRDGLPALGQGQAVLQQRADQLIPEQRGPLPAVWCRRGPARSLLSSSPSRPGPPPCAEPGTAAGALSVIRPPPFRGKQGTLPQFPPRRRLSHSRVCESRVKRHRQRSGHEAPSADKADTLPFPAARISPPGCRIRRYRTQHSQQFHDQAASGNYRDIIPGAE